MNAVAFGEISMPLMPISLPIVAPIYTWQTPSTMPAPSLKLLLKKLDKMMFGKKREIEWTEAGKWVKGCENIGL